jgi:hypothetical protein
MRKSSNIILFVCCLIFNSAVVFAQNAVTVTSGNLTIRYDNPQLDTPETRTSFTFNGNQFSAVGDDTKSGTTAQRRSPSPLTSAETNFFPLQFGRATVTVGGQSFSNIYLSNLNSTTTTNLLFSNNFFIPKLATNQRTAEFQTNFTMQGRFACFSDYTSLPNQLCNLNISGNGTVKYTFQRSGNFLGRWRNYVWLSQIRYEFQNQ